VILSHLLMTCACSDIYLMTYSLFNMCSQRMHAFSCTRVDCALFSAVPHVDETVSQFIEVGKTRCSITTQILYWVKIRAVERPLARWESQMSLGVLSCTRSLSSWKINIGLFDDISRRLATASALTCSRPTSRKKTNKQIKHLYQLDVAWH